VSVTHDTIYSVLRVRSRSTRSRALEEPKLPKFDYHLDESDPDVVVLRRQDGTFVAAFSARGATKEGIVEAAKEDYRALLEKHGLTEHGGAVQRGG
jgi:hypothetical protein